ncbi:MAG: hypothetical protein ABI867_27790 [Kofleriaceae bacterium]
MRRVLVSVAFAGCHVTSATEITRPGKPTRIPHPEHAIARAPTLVLTETGRLRFIEPLECPTEELGSPETATEHVVGPNLATFVVGVVATAVGGVMTVRGVTDADPGGSPFTYAGIGLLAAGLPFAIGPWIGNRRFVLGSEGKAVRRPGPNEPCGERPLAARAATLSMRGMEVRGAIDRDGMFAISPYQIVDAYETVSVPAWDVSAVVELETGTRTVTAMLDGGAFATRAKQFLATADFETKVEPMRVIPNLVPGMLRVSLTPTADGHSIRIVMPLKNDGPGPAWALRGHVIAPGTPAVDGRVLYIGALANGASSSRELLVPVSEAVAATVRNVTIELTLELRDAHGTAPTTPVKFRGPILVDAPR